MMRIPTRGSVALIVLAVALGLAGCSSEGDVDLSSPGSIRNAACEDVNDLVNKLTELKDESTSPGKRNALERELGINVDDDLDTAMDGLNERAERCDDNDPESEATSDPSPSESPSSSPTSSPSASPSSDSTPIVRSVDGILGWDQLPSEARNRIDEHSSEIGYDVEDTEVWAVATKPSGNLADARAVLVFGLPDTTDAEARSLADVKRRTPVVRVTSCTDIVGQGCADDQIRVILAPLSIEDGTVKGLRPGTGVVLKGNFPLITYES